ncbi:MAG: SRPBCC domain-containing protein [Bacteroidota bacterium]
MKNLETEIIINAPAEKVWNILTDFEKFPEWNPLILRIEGKQELGAQLLVELNNGKGSSVFKPKVVRLEKNKAFEWQGNLPLGMFTGRHQFRIEKLSDTQVKFIHREDFSGWLSGLIMKQIGEGTRKGFIKMNEALKKRAEG